MTFSPSFVCFLIFFMTGFFFSFYFFFCFLFFVFCFLFFVFSFGRGVLTWSWPGLSSYLVYICPIKCPSFIFPPSCYSLSLKSPDGKDSNILADISVLTHTHTHKHTNMHTHTYTHTFRPGFLPLLSLFSLITEKKPQTTAQLSGFIRRIKSYQWCFFCKSEGSGRGERKKSQNASKMCSARSTWDNTCELNVKTKLNLNCHHKMSIISLHLLGEAFTIITQTPAGTGA